VGVTPTFEEFATARLAALLRHAVVLTGDRALAEDVVQEVLARAHARWSRIERLDQPEAYVRRMIVNEYLSWRRRFARVSPMETVTPPRPDGPDHATTHADREALRADLARLPRQQRAVLVLRYYEGMTDAEIAAVLGCTAGTVRGYAARALARLRIEAAADRSSRHRAPLSGGSR
jgi:RNA polymerase sigma-70 factor (sigma-E family)